MPSPEEIKRIIDSGAYASGATQCAGSTVAWQAAKGVFPKPALAKKYIKLAEELHDASEAMVEELMTRAEI